jgi:hypothetical protein
MYLGQIFGLTFVIVSLAFLFGKAKATLAARSLLANDGALLLMEIAALVIGLALVLTQNNWGNGALAVVIDIIGWVTMLKGLVGLFISDLSLRKFYEFFHYERWFYLIMTIMLLIGIWMTYAGYKGY